MTQRSELQHRVLEYKSVLKTWVAGKVFTFRKTGLDGWVKRRMLPGEASGKSGGNSYGA